MLLLLIVAPVALATAAPASTRLGEAAHALSAGRTSQARTMVSAAIAEGASGDAVDRLLADLAFAEGRFDQASARYDLLSMAHPAEGRLAEQAGLSALRLRQTAKAAAQLDRAVKLPGATWRAWNGKGVAADYRGEWAVADEAYRNAARLAPTRAEVANNLGWSLMLRGEWRSAIVELERAARLDPASARIADNLELARTAIGEDLPKRHSGESSEAYAARLNDAGVVARIQGDRRRAVAAFTRALEARSLWFERAANNLAQTEPPK